MSGEAPLGRARQGTNAAFSVRPFTRLARVHAGSTAGDAMVAAALAGTIFFGAATGEARGQTFLYLLLTMAPFAVVAPLIGPALDRAKSGRRWIVIGTAAARALLCFALIGRADTLLLYPIAFSVLVLQKGYGIARSSLVPAVVATDSELVEANSKLQLIAGLMGFVGVAPAALLFKLFDDNPDPALALAVCTFAATAGMALKLPKVAVASADPTPEERAELRTFGVLLAAGGMGLLRGVVGYLTLYFAFHFREIDDPGGFAVIAAVSLIGTLAGTIVAPRLREWWPEERMLISVLVLTTGVALLAVVVGGVLGGALLGGVVGVASTGGKLAFDSIVQRDAPDANRGRLFARFETRFQLIWVVGAMLGLIELSEIRVPYLAVALVAGFASFSYIVGLTAWRHRTGESDSSFGRQAVLIDQTMTDIQDRAKHRVRSSARAVTGKVRRGGRPTRPRHLPEDQAGPGVGGAMSADDLAAAHAGAYEHALAHQRRGPAHQAPLAPPPAPPDAPTPAPPDTPTAIEPSPWLAPDSAPPAAPSPAAPAGLVAPPTAEWPAAPIDERPTAVEADDLIWADHDPTPAPPPPLGPRRAPAASEADPDDPTVFDPRPIPPRHEDPTAVWDGDDPTQVER